MIGWAIGFLCGGSSGIKYVYQQKRRGKMNRRVESWAIMGGLLMLIALGAVGHWCIANVDDQKTKQPFFKALEGEDLKKNPLFQIPNNCVLTRPTSVKSKSKDRAVIFTYKKTCKDGNADITEHLFAICERYYPYGQNEYSKIQCQTSGWISLQ